MSPLTKEELKFHKILESYSQFAPRWVKEVKIKLFLNYPLKLPWLLDGSVRNVFFSPFCFSILIRCIVFIGLAKFPERKGSILPSSFYGQLPNYLDPTVSPIYLVDDFYFSFLLFLLLRPSQQRAGWHNLVCVECL